MKMLVKFGLWTARLGGWKQPRCTRPHLPEDDQVEMVKTICEDVRNRYTDAPGDIKRREVLRVLLNLRPTARERDLNLLIELALQ
jgi:hypothetical protein